MRGLYVIGGLLLALACAGMVAWGSHFMAGFLLGGLWTVWGLAWDEVRPKPAPAHPADQPAKKP